MQRYANLKKSPSPKKEYVLETSSLSGGINLWDPNFRLKPSESPEMKNLLWRNGMLCSRKGQYYLCPYQLGQGFAAYPRLWHGCIFAHIGGNIFCFRLEARSQSAASGSGDESGGTISAVYPSLNEGVQRDTMETQGTILCVPGTRPDSTRVPSVFRRRPMCRRVLHFTMKLINSNLNEDFELVGAQVFFNVQGRLR